MKTRKPYLLVLLAAAALLAIAAYEYYWIKGLYITRRDAAETEIRVSIVWAEMQVLNGSSISLTTRLNERMNIRIKTIVSSSIEIADSLAVKMDSSTTPAPYEIKAGGTDLQVMDSILVHMLDSLGYPLKHRLALMDEEEVLAETSTFGYTPSSWDGHLTISSIRHISHDLLYNLDYEPMWPFLIRRMSGVLLMSVGILLILALVFYLMMRALRKQRELDEMKSDFTSNMTHELKTPIAVAYAANDAMLVYGLDRNPEKREEYLKVTRKSLEKLNGMVEQILSMSMENRGSLPLRIERTELSPLLESIAAQARLSAGKPCEITVSVMPEGLTANIDASLMSSVLATLLDNAVKYSGDSADIHLSAEEKEGHVRIAVRDKGIGIAPEKQAHIFEKFYRVPTGDVHNVKGYGIGLFFAKTIVEKHGGHISVSSEPGKGSTFTIDMPPFIQNEEENL